MEVYFRVHATKKGFFGSWIWSKDHSRRRNVLVYGYKNKESDSTFSTNKFW